MPIYEYRCTNGHTFEVFQSMSEDPVDKCIECGVTAERVLSAPAIHYKGSGFYTTDYGRSRKKEPSKDGAGAESGGEPKKKEEKKKAAEA